MAFGRVAVLGDAAFVARPHVAAGVSKASDDAAALAEALTAEGDVEAGLKRFEAARLKENHSIIQRARHLGAYLQATRSAGGTGARRQAQHRRSGDRGDGGAGFSVCVSELNRLSCPLTRHRRMRTGRRNARIARLIAGEPRMTAARYSPSSFFAVPPASAARVASSKLSTEAMWPMGSCSSMSKG